MKLASQILHWMAYIYLAYLFGYASLFKVFKKKSMIENMEDFGFSETWTLWIGYGELLGLTSLIVGLWYHEAKNLAAVWLLFFAVGALMVHFAHKDYHDFYDALFGCVAAVVLLVTDKYFKIDI